MTRTVSHLRAIALTLAVLPVSPTTHAAEPFSDPLASGGSGPDMVPIDIGRIRMGKLRGDEWCGNNEPTRHVEIRHPFAMSRDEITVAEFEQFVRSTGYVTSAEKQSGPRSLAGRRKVPEGACVHSSFSGHAPHRADVGAHWRNPGYRQGPRYPVVCVNYDDASAYASWLADETGYPYELPSEAQWEYAARALRADADLLMEQTSTVRAIKTTVYERRRVGLPGPVNHRKENPFGIRGIGGLVESGWVIAEWTADCWNNSYRGAPTDGSVWQAGDCIRAVVRDGGAEPVTCRSGKHRRISSTAQGLRVVRNRIW